MEFMVACFVLFVVLVIAVYLFYQLSFVIRCEDTFDDVSEVIRMVNDKE